MTRIFTHPAVLLLWLCSFVLARGNNEEDQSPKREISKLFKVTVGENFFLHKPDFKISALAKDFLNINDDECDDEDNIETTISPTETMQTDPASQPQVQPSSKPSSQPSHLPTTTSAPSLRTRVSLSCPDQSGEESLGHVVVPQNSVLSVAPSNKDTLCSLNFMMSRDGEEVTIPVGRSYNGNSWESVPGPIRLMFECDDNNDCVTDVPEKSFLLVNDDDLNSDGYFQLTALNLKNITSQDIAARFLEQSTFGITKTDLEPWMDVDVTNSLHELDDSFADWMENQINTVEGTSHRKYYRERATIRAVNGVKNQGSPTSPCEAGSRWRLYPFSWLESLAYNYRDRPLLEIEATLDGSSYLMLFDGKAYTETNNIEVMKWRDHPAFNLTVGEKYTLCRWEWSQDEYVGGMFCIYYNGARRYFTHGQPEIKFDSVDGKRPEHVIQVDSSLYDDLVQVSGTNTIGEELILPNGITGHDDVCNNLSLENYPVFLDFQDGRWLMFDPMLKLIENEPDSPAENGGYDSYLHGSLCPNAYRTFLNEDTCVLSGDSPACSNEVDNEEFEIPLAEDDIINLFSLTGRYVYAVDGLRPEMSASPCIAKKRSRWLNIGNSSSCTMTTFSDETGLTLSELIEDTLEDDEGTSDTLDILYRDTRDDCSIPITQNITADPVFIISEETCWQLVHPDHHSVFDFTEWVSNHPGMAPAITQFAENGDAFLSFPSHHELWQWDQGENFREYVGRLDRKTSFRDLPASLQLDPVLTEYGFGSFETSSKVLICGSPNEAASDPTKGEHGLTFDLHNDYFDSVPDTPKYNQKFNLWTKIATYSEDQLRQRMAWALSQIFPLSQDATGLDDNTEQALYYYDIFVRHAFLNYFDVLKEVSYSPLMSSMLTYYRSKSTAYTLQRYKVISFADENFAREIMQLFTIGTIMLNIDGSPILDEYGNEILSYTNDHIMSYARAWTGFDRHDDRGNTETINNKIDPLKIVPEWRDVFPKIDLIGGHVGDRIPLCVDLPAKHFLRKGATYRLLGSRKRFELQENMRYGNLNLAHVNITLDESSELFAKLCNDPSNSGNCNFLSKVVLDENLECHDRECNVDTLGIIQVTEGIWFEYLRQPCVELAYYNDAKVINVQHRGSTSRPEMCANPKLEAAGEACCLEEISDAARGANCEYTFEKMTFDTNSDRCQDIGQTTCSYRYLRYYNNDIDDNPNLQCHYYWWFPHWVDTECLLKVKVDGALGKAAIVHDTLNPYLTGDVTNTQENVRESTPNFFSVYWDDEDFPSFDNHCGNVCSSVYDGCVCNTTVIEEAVFTEAPNSIEEVMELLFIGSVSPDTFDESYYDDPVTLVDGVEVFFKSGTGQSYDMETIFMVERLNKTFYLKNMRSDVVILDQEGNPTSFSFRNPPHFLDLQYGDQRDAHYETQAVLESYFYHPNVPPFLAIHFIQRFGISNPSPRYIEAVATAFKTGVYEYEKNSDSSIMTFGKTGYGDLEATIAAVLLDREARSIVLDSDPTYGGMKEPLMKVINVFRAMEFAPDLTQGSQRYNMVLRSMSERIGQMTHDYESIFSFFRREFAPVGLVQQGDLVAPEGQRYNSPSAISLMNGLYALVKFGLTACYQGFGYDLYSCRGRNEGDFGSSYGHLTFSPENSTDMESVVNELALLLTAGRLDSERRSIIARVASDAEDDGAGLRIAQQLVLSSPEFHTTNVLEFSGTPRNVPDPPNPSDKPYKAVVVMLLNGGLDSYNLIIPHSGCDTDMYGHYVDVRGSVNIPYTQLANSIIPSKTSQVCENFAIHPSLPLLKTLYDDDNLSFFANTGVLRKYVNKRTWSLETKTPLFAHNFQQRDAQQVYLDGVQNTGVVGRMADVLTNMGYQTGSFSISGENFLLSGLPSKSPLPVMLSRSGLPDFNQKESVDDMNSLFYDLNNATNTFGGKFGKTWSDIFDSAIRQNKYLSSVLDDVALNTTFPSSRFGQTLNMVATVMKARDSLGHDRQFFFVETGGWDTHSNQFASDDVRFPELNDALSAFVDEMKDQGLWDDVTFMEISDFARTMSANSGDGTDHAWGGNYFMFGGSVKSQILGTYPSDLSSDGELNIGRGRLIPTTAFEEIWNGIGEWMGIDDDEGLNRFLPSRSNFNLFSKSDLFK